MKIFRLILIALLTTNNVICQNVDTIYKFTCPLENGHIKEINRPKFSGSNPTENVTIIAKSDSIVIAIEDGIINKIIEGNLYGVIVKKDNLFFVYKGLKNMVLKENEYIKKGDKIGIADKCSDDNNYQVKIEIWNNIDKIKADRLMFDCK